MPDNWQHISDIIKKIIKKANPKKEKTLGGSPHE
jgi:hypothetical protein